MSVEATLNLAKQLIIQRQYVVALQLLNTIVGNPQADDWRAKLEAGIAAATPAEIEFPTDADIVPLKDLPPAPIRRGAKFSLYAMRAAL